MFSFFGGVLLVPFPSIQSIYSDHVHCVHGWSESKHDKERYTQKCSNFFILQHVSSNFEILCVCDVLFVVFSKLIYQSKANPFPRCVYLYRSKTAFNSQSSILCTYVKRRRWKKEPVRNQSSVHIWTVWKRKSKLNTENKRIFFFDWITLITRTGEWSVLAATNFLHDVLFALSLLTQVLFISWYIAYKHTHTHTHYNHWESRANWTKFFSLFILFISFAFGN